MSTESKLMSQKDYLKKYLSGPSEEKKKKKKKLKKSEGTVRPKVKVIDDDVDLSKLQPIDESALDLYELNEDAPQVVGVVDDRPPELQVLDQYKQGQRWRVLGAPDGDGVSVSEFNRPQQSSSDVEEGYSVKPPSKACSSSKVQWKDIDSSPPRKRQQDSDESPPRKKKQFDSDESPPRKKKQFDSDESPPRKKKQYDSDESPPRKEKQHSSDSHSFQKTAHYDSLQKKKYKNFNESPPGREKKFDSDESPPRKRHQDNYDASHFRRKKHSNSNTSPARKSLNSDSDESPPRKKDISASSRLKQTEKSNRYSNKREHYLDASPSRRKRHESDVSPQSRKKNQSYDTSPSRKPSHQRYSEETDSRRMRVEREKDNSVEKKEKMKKTLDGKDAGLQDARKLKQELMDLKKREERAFQKMDDSLSGKGAMAVQRDRKTGLKRDLEREQAEERAKEEKESKNKEKYTRWGKGLKQTENQQERFERDMYEMSKPLARYADDQDLESYLKGQEREGDPMLEYLRKKKKDEAKSNVPLYQGSFPPNRYNIRPGYRWDGVDRSNGYEKKRFEAMNAKKAVEEEAYKWSTSDM